MSEAFVFAAAARAHRFSGVSAGMANGKSNRVKEECG